MPKREAIDEMELDMPEEGEMPEGEESPEGEDLAEEGEDLAEMPESPLDSVGDDELLAEIKKRGLMSKLEEGEGDMAEMPEGEEEDEMYI